MMYLLLQTRIRLTGPQPAPTDFSDFIWVAAILGVSAIIVAINWKKK